MKLFLVLDDVWTEDSTKWEPFKNAFKCVAQGSRILVTTRKNSVAADDGEFLHDQFGGIVLHDSWLMFSKIAFSNEDREQRKALEDLGRQLPNKCKGLLLALKTPGSLMHNKRSREQWKNILDSNLWEIQDFKKGLLVPLLLSYYELPLEVKSCLSCCAIFPKDHYFRRDELVLLWISQGYIDSKANMEIIAEDYFENLAKHSFFQDFVKDEIDGRIVRCKMHDIVHDFVQSMTKNECFIIDVDEEVKIDFKRARQLSLRVKEIIHESVYDAKNVRFLNLNFLSFHTVPPILFHHLTCLRALRLKGKSIEKLPNEVEKLIHLRYLELSCINVKELPETICDLYNLQSLNVCNCINLLKLPHRMGKLINLRHLLLNDFYEMTSFPKGIGRITSLGTLTYFPIGGKFDEICKLGNLKTLNHLQGNLDITRLGKVVDVSEVKNAQLNKKIHLCGLNLNFVTEEDEAMDIRRMENDVLVLNALEPHLDLELLSIHYYTGTTVYPNWMMSLTKLETLRIYECPKLVCLPPLGKLPFLESLEMFEVNSLKKVGVEFFGIDSKNKNNKDDIIFPKLKSLRFWGFEKWEEWIWIGVGEEEEEDNGFVTNTIITMPHLHSLTIENCPKLKSLPDFLHTAPLKELLIHCCPLLHEHCEKGTREDWPKISHIPNMKIGYEYVQRDD